MKIVLTLLFFNVTIYTTACLNLSGTNIDGEFHSIGMIPRLYEPTNYPSKYSIYGDLSRLFENEKRMMIFILMSQHYKYMTVNINVQ
tara:strand:+ start:259 stop:519 length:261 start_codon:yes stop_codon:yes gene_type:complete